MPCVRVPWLVTRLVVPLIDDYFDYAAVTTQEFRCVNFAKK
jgi:hypothetical protein